ncbi:MAG: molybdopterin-dependent oxidoreductase, partial [Synechococcaceae cyanobacterium RL_1_2]|nr:molybdopterin-dependent oxidoreductase [Synechococcaceae cyanobacterium RL_1_2]
MANLHLPPEWSISEHHVTPERHYLTRRSVLKGMLGLTASIAAVGLTGCEQSSEDEAFKQSINLPKIPDYNQNPNFLTVDRPMTEQTLASSYNNFYEFGGSKNIWLKAQNLPLENWKIEVGGLVKNPRTYDLEDLKRAFPLEERIYRFR